jgi:hypothetical protein
MLSGGWKVLRVGPAPLTLVSLASYPRNAVVDSAEQLVADFSAALAAYDATAPVGPSRRFRPGVGPLTETELTHGIIQEWQARDLPAYRACGPRGYPGSRATCDLVTPSGWAIEIKLARPFGDNGKPAERWSENLLYPYPGNTSAIGDCLKLLDSHFTERKAVLVVGYEHSPPKIPLEPAVRGFELLATEVCGIELGRRAEQLVERLIHPHHQQARIYAWEVRGRHPTAG